MADPDLMALARRLRNLEHNVRQTKQPNLGFSTIDGGAIQATNGVDETLTLVMGEQFDGTNTAASITGPTPPTPTQALTTSAPGALRVYWDGTFEGGVFSPMDWARVTVHIVPFAEYDPGTFTPLDQTQIYGSFETARGGEVSPVLEPGDYVAILVSWTQSGKFSVPSEPALGTVSLIDTGGGPDGFAPSTAPTIAWTGGIGSVFYRWTQVANADPTEYALYVRAGDAPTTADDTYLVAAGNIGQAVVRKALGENPEDPTGPEIERAVTPGLDFFGVVVAYDADGQGPDSMPAIAQSVEINSPDIATDAITTRHLQADSVGVDQLQAGSVEADSLAARLILASEMLLGTLDNNGLDPASLAPNLLPTFAADKIAPVGTTVEGSWNSNGTAAGWNLAAEQFSPPNDDGYWQRMAVGSLQALRADRASALTGTASQVVMRTRVTVEPLTEYRFEMNSSMPGMDPNMALAGANNAILNSVKWFVSTDDSYQSPEVFSWKTFVKDDTPRPDLTKFDRGVIRTGTGQTTLYIKLEINANHMLANTGGFQIVFPELRKVESTTVAGADPVVPASVAAADVSPSPTSAVWQASAVWSGTTSSIVRTPSVYTVGASGGAFGPSKFSTPGRYAIPGQAQTFQQAKGVRITTQSGGSGLGLRARIVAPVQIVPTLGPLEGLFVNVGLAGLTQAVDGLDDVSFTASWYDGADALISNQALIDFDVAGLIAQGITNLTENYWNIQLVPPTGAAKVVFWAEYSNGPSGNVAASTNLTPSLHGLRLYTLNTINYNYGSMAARRVEIDSSGIRMVNAQGQVQISIPTDENETPLFRGGIEADWLRVFGGASLEGQSEVAKDATVTLSDGIKSPVATPTLTQEYEQYTMQRVPEDWVGFSTRPTLNPSQITGMVWNQHWGQFFITENRGGGIGIWRMRTDGTLPWASFLEGFEWATPLYDAGSHTNANLIAGQFGGNFWAYVSNGTSTILNRIPDGVVPSDVHPQYYWNNANDRLYVFYPHIDGSGRNVYKRLAMTNTPSGTMTLEDTTTSGTGTSRSSWASGLAGVAIVGAEIYTAARNTTAADVYTFATGSGGALDAGDRWSVPSPPVGFCYDDDHFWQIDTAGKLTKFSDWTWPETNHKLYGGVTWFDSDTGGTGTHETDLTTLATITLKKRISGIRATLPRVPDAGGTDDPDRLRFYAFKGASLTLPAGRTSMFLQAQAGSATGTTTYIIPANGLVVAGTNPPATNNFPGAGAGRLISSAVDGLGNPVTNLKGNGETDLGNFKVRSGAANIGRRQTWGITVAGATVPDAGGAPTVQTTNFAVIAERPGTPHGWAGITYSGGGLFTVDETGEYELEFYRNWASGSGRRILFIWINQASPSTSNAYRRHELQVPTATSFGHWVRCGAYLVAGDTIKVGFYQTGVAGGLAGSATAGALYSGTNYSHTFEATRLG